MSGCLPATATIHPRVAVGVRPHPPARPEPVEGRADPSTRGCMPAYGPIHPLVLSLPKGVRTHPPAVHAGVRAYPPARPEPVEGRADPSTRGCLPAYGPIHPLVLSLSKGVRTHPPAGACRRTGPYTRSS